MRLMIFSIGMLGLAACGPLPVYYRADTAFGQQQTDELACAVKALKEAPVANEIRQRPPVYYPGGQYCSGGNCWTRPGYWVDGGIYTVDVNEGLRSRLEQSCMAQKGYQRLELPRCSKEEIATYSTPAGPAASGTGLSGSVRSGTGQSSVQKSGRNSPVLTQQSCVVRLKDGSTRILSPL